MALSSRDSALAALYCNPVFQSSVRVEAHDQVAREFADHALRWRSGFPDAAMFKGEIGCINVYALRYGPEVEVSANPFNGFSLVHTSLSAGAEIECDGHRLWVAEGRTAVLSPKTGIRLRWSPGSQQFIVRIPNSLLHLAAGDDSAALATGYLLPRVLETQWDLIARSLLNLLSCTNNSVIHANWAEHLGCSLAQFLLLHAPTGPCPLPERLQDARRASFASDTVVPGNHGMDAVINYIESHLSAPVAVEDLARAAGVSCRTLSTMCRNQFGVAPLELLRNARLDAVRSRLLLDPAASITESALEFGFGHLGRFSGYYAARFKELPSETRTRHA